jgi:hypothetical protein
MSHALQAALLAAALFAGMVVLLEVGRRLGARDRARDPEAKGIGAVDGAIFGLLGLLLAFTFSGAASRFDTRRHLIVEETNAIGTAYLRLDLLAEPARLALQDKFRRYLDSRIDTYRKVPDMAAVKLELATTNRLQNEIWSEAVRAASAQQSPAATSLLLSALNEMIDITTTRTLAAEMHPPAVVFAMLYGVSLISALLAGFGMSASTTRKGLHICAFAAVVAAAVYVILDLEYPRLGLIRVDALDHALVDLRRSMDQQGVVAP